MCHPTTAKSWAKGTSSFPFTVILPNHAGSHKVCGNQKFLNFRRSGNRHHRPFKKSDRFWANWTTALVRISLTGTSAGVVTFLIASILPTIGWGVICRIWTLFSFLGQTDSKNYGRALTKCHFRNSVKIGCAWSHLTREVFLAHRSQNCCSTCYLRRSGGKRGGGEKGTLRDGTLGRGAALGSERLKIISIVSFKTPHSIDQFGVWFNWRKDFSKAADTSTSTPQFYQNNRHLCFNTANFSKQLTPLLQHHKFLKTTDTSASTPQISQKPFSFFKTIFRKTTWHSRFAKLRLSLNCRRSLFIDTFGSPYVFWHNQKLIFVKSG